MKTGAEAIRALATQLPVFRQKLSDGWYQVRIAGRDVSTSGLTAQLHCIDSLEVRKKPGGHWIIRYLAGLDLVGLASL